MATTPEPGPRVILIGTTILYAGTLYLCFRSSNLGAALSFSADGIQNVGRTFAPLVAISAFIERAVEIAIATTRGPGALALKRDLEVATATNNEIAKDEARRKMGAYKLHTQRYSFAFSLSLSLFAGVVGVRAVSPLLDKAATPPTRYFDLFDVILTSLLLAGGCDGIHQVVTTITSYLDNTKSNNRQKANPSS